MSNLPLNTLLSYLQASFFCTLFVCSLLSFSALSTSAEDKYLVVTTSNQPLALLANDILGEAGKASSLLKPGQTPHDFSLSFSDRKRISETNLMVWIGPDIEPYLDKIITSAEINHLRLDQFFDAPTSAQEINDKEEITEQHHEHSHAQHQIDVHFWLDPNKAVTIANNVYRQLAHLAPEQEKGLQTNLTKLLTRIRSTEEHIQRQLEGQTKISDSVYGTAHNAYSHFIHHFDLPEPVLISQSTESSPGIKQLLKIRRQLPKGSCLIVEPEHATGWPQQLASREGYQLQKIDTLASQRHYQNYSEWLQQLANDLIPCLEQSP